MVIDNRGYRLCIGIVLINREGKLFWGKRYRQKNAWQFPQGGLMPYETIEEAMYRELGEEVGLKEEDVEIIGVTKRWLHYKLPVKLRRYSQKPLCIGQKQKWFLLRFLADDTKICLEQESPEFDEWRWVDYWYPEQHVIFFKRGVYELVLQEFARVAKQ
jgi:putative (di)nucleoside polyphosphate hydrolase